MSVTMNLTMKPKPELGQSQSSKPVAQTPEQRVATVDVDASLEDVLNRLRETGRHCLPVVNEVQVVLACWALKISQSLRAYVAPINPCAPRSFVLISSSRRTSLSA